MRNTCDAHDLALIKGKCPGIEAHCAKGEHCTATDAACAAGWRLDPCNVCCSCGASLREEWERQYGEVPC